MKQIRLQKVLTLLVASVVLVGSISLISIQPTLATNTTAFTEITPSSGGSYNTSPAMTNTSLWYAGNENYYTSKWTTFADLVETKANGAKVFHFFMAVPWSNQYYWNGYGGGNVYHYSSLDSPKVWKQINPGDWGTFGGANHITLKAIPQTWTDSTGSQWNKKLFMLTNDGTESADYNYAYYANWKAVLYRYDGNGSNSMWATMFGVKPGGFNANPRKYTYGNYLGSANMHYHYGPKTYFEYADVTNDGIDNGTIYMIIPWAYGSTGSGTNRLNVLKYTGTRNPITGVDDLIKTATPPQMWQETQIPIDYSAAYYQGNVTIFDFVKAGNYLWLSTAPTGNTSNTPYNVNNGKFYRIDPSTNPPTILYVAPPPPPPWGRVTSGLIYDGAQNKYYFNMEIGGTWTTTFPYTYSPVTGTVRAYVKTYGTLGYTVCWMNFGSPNDYSPYYMPSPYGYGYFGYYCYPNQFGGTSWPGVVVYRQTPGSTNIYGANTMLLDGFEANPYWGYGSYYQSPRGLLGGGGASPAPISMIEFKGYLYAGSMNGVLRRTNNFNPSTPLDVLNLSTWQTVSPVRGLNALNQIRTQTNAITALGKTQAKNISGALEDSLLYIGGAASGEYYFGPGEGVLYTTDASSTPVTYNITEDEWRYTKGDTALSSQYKNSLWEIYDIQSSALGIVVSFNSNRRRFPSPYGDRYFHLFNAQPTCDVTIVPEPVINERGTDTNVMFQFRPIGGFGAGNVKITLELPPNVFLPTKDGNNQPINTQFNKSIYMGGGIITINAVIRSTNAATVKKYLAKAIINDLALDLPIARMFEFIIVYPKPGYSVNVSPSMFPLYQGTCPPNQCCSESCQQVSVDLVSRNDFEDNVIIGVNWIDKPPSNDVTLQWQQSTFIYDFIDDKTIEAITRKNIGTRYLMQVKVTPNTTVGTWKFKMFFISGTIKKSQIVQFTVAPAKPGIKITSNPSVIRVVPGAIASYRLLIESVNGFVGKVNLTLQNLPPNVTVLSFRAELPPPGYADNYVDISPGNPAYANLVIQTYSITTAPTNPRKVTIAQVNEKLNSITWDFSFKGSYPIAGYEIWRGTSQFIDTAVRLGIVNSGTNAFDDNTILRDKSYFYFVRAFDTQIPPNYSTYTSSGEFKTTSTNIFGTISNEGTLPGFNNIEILGQGVGYGPDLAAVTPIGLGISVLHIYEQVQNMATPAFTWWASLILLISMLAVFLLLNSKKEKKTSK